MSTHRHTSDDGAPSAVGRAHPGPATGGTRDRAADWTPDHSVDPGDSHDKGESLCVGEAA